MDDQETSKKPIIIAIIILLLLIGSCTGWNALRQNSSDFHLEKAAASLNELEILLASKEAGEEVDDELIAELTAQILEETNAALEIAEENLDAEVLNQINDFQTETLETFDEALTIIEDESIIDILEEAIDQTQEEQLELLDTLDSVIEAPVVEEVVADETTETLSPSDTEGVLDVLESSSADETAIEAVESNIIKKEETPEIPESEVSDPEIPASANGNGNSNR